MLRKPTPSDGLVLAQFVAIGGVVLWPGEPLWALPGVVRYTSLVVVLAGLLLGAAALVALGRDLTPFVDPPAGAGLRTTGPYALSRNPIYAGLLLAAVGWAVLRARPEPAVAAGLLAAVLHVKIGVETRRLGHRFGADYQDYQSRVPRLLGLPRRGQRTAR